MKKFKCLILIDDSVFLQHIIGLIVILCDKGVKPSLLIDNVVNKDLVAYQLIIAMHKDNEILIVSLNKEDYSKTVLKFDYIFTQWGPPRSIGRIFSQVKRNKLLHSITLSGGRIVSFPHGFEIKDMGLTISWKARLRALLCDLSLNPFKDYSRYFDRYFFETNFHRTRYNRYMGEKFSGVIGFPTFNPYSLDEINNRLIRYGIQPRRVLGKVLIMPKFRHIGTKRIDILNDVDYVIPHPREYGLQYDFLREKFPQINILKSLDFFSLGDYIHIIDFGTSVSILGKLFGAKVTYINMLSHEPFFSESDFSGMVKSDFFSCGHNSYESYATYVLSEIMANDDE
jgi:hypothetical protein